MESGVVKVQPVSTPPSTRAARVSVPPVLIAPLRVSACAPFSNSAGATLTLVLSF